MSNDASRRYGKQGPQERGQRDQSPGGQRDQSPGGQRDQSPGGQRDRSSAEERLKHYTRLFENHEKIISLRSTGQNIIPDGEVISPHALRSQPEGSERNLERSEPASVATLRRFNTSSKEIIDIIIGSKEVSEKDLDTFQKMLQSVSDLPGPTYEANADQADQLVKYERRCKTLLEEFREKYSVPGLSQVSERTEDSVPRPSDETVGEGEGKGKSDGESPAKKKVKPDIAAGRLPGTSGEKVAQQENPVSSDEISRANRLKAEKEQKRESAALAIINSRDRIDGLENMLYEDFYHKYPKEDNRRKSAQRMRDTIQEIDNRLDDFTHLTGPTPRKRTQQMIRDHLKELEDDADHPDTHKEVRELMQEFFEDIGLR